ncbi:hypothetical protein N7450_001002 [Penicillium hetheringtonii]|uniref:Xylanolytic transcriptional activator regulatory domain-containing protein n=1 Tax=Penicillium hetheringtonii TaxID=911720 RepID=A0AAD6E4G8_9EURO|nr:hypothetical protein N7450_001002 [Penicillium hetheringtonii]
MLATGRPLATIAIRCDRDTPKCDKCKAARAECTYKSRKPRTKKPGPDLSERGILLEVLERLKRLEDHCGLDKAAENQERRCRFDSIQETPLSEITTTIIPAGIRDILSRIKDEGSRSMLLSNVFCHLQQVQSCFFANQQCFRAITSAMAEIQFMQDTQLTEPPEREPIPKELARQFIDYFYSFYQFEGFRVPLEQSFLSSIPDLLEIPHVQLDYTSQIIYYTIILQGMVSNPGDLPRRGHYIQFLYQKCVSLSENWLQNVKETPADFFAALTLISIALEGCNIDLSWKALHQAIRISKALGYFSVDETPSSGDNLHLTEPGSAPHQAEIEKNRKRFEFWHLVRTDSFFRMSFGKPGLIPSGSWKVNFPDPTITGVDHESSRFIQIHFLASMRLALIVMKYLDWVDAGKNPDPVTHDSIIDDFIDEVQSVLVDWDTEGLLRMTKNHVDIWFCVDVLFSSYKTLIVLYQSKICAQGPILPPQAVEISRKSVNLFRSLLETSGNAFWGFIPFFILCLDIVGNPEHSHLEEDLVSIGWISDYVELVISERVELKPVMIIIKSMATACQQTKLDRLSLSTDETHIQ